MSDLIPDGWDESTLGQLVDARSSNVDKKIVEGELPVLLCNYTDVYYNNKISRKIPFMQASAKTREIERFTLKTGDVIITKDSETPNDIAVPTYVTENLDGVLCGYHLTLLRPNNKKSCGEYLAHLFQLSSVRHHFYLLASGITRFGLTADAITNAPLVVPPLSEQQKIAAILTSVDEVIEKTQAQIDKLKDLKTGMMQQLLTSGVGIDGKSHTEFKDSPVGRIPKGWEVVALGDVGKWKGGGTPSKGNKSFWIGDIPWVSPKDMKFEYISKTKDYISHEAIKGSSTNIVEKNSLLIVVRSGILQHTLPIAIAACELTINQDMKALTLSDNYYSEYIYHYIKANNHKVLRATLKAGNTVESIDFAEFSKFKIPSPPFKEQKEIADAVESVAINVRKKERLMISYKNTKKALMQDLLTGKVRVNVASETGGH